MSKEKVIYKFYELENMTQEDLNTLASERNQLARENQHLKEELNTCMVERNKFLDIIEETINKCKLEIRASSYQYEQRHKQQDLVYKVAHERILDILQKYEGVSNE